jgi:hypothetical protein
LASVPAFEKKGVSNMKALKQVLIPLLSFLILASAAFAALHPPVKMTKEEARDHYRNLIASAGAMSAADPKVNVRDQGTAMGIAPIKADPHYGAKLLVNGLDAPEGLGVGTLGDYVLIDEWSTGALLAYTKNQLKVLGYPGFYPSAGRMWGHFYFGDHAGNLFRLETDNHTVTPIWTDWDIPGLYVNGLDVDHTTGWIFFSLNIMFLGYPEVDFYVYDPVHDEMYYFGYLEDEFNYGLAVKGTNLYFGLWFENVILRWNWKWDSDLYLFTDKISGPGDMIFDAKGNMFVCDYYGGNILKFNETATQRTKIAWNIYEPVYLGLDKRGDVFFSDYGGEVWKLRKK